MFERLNSSKTWIIYETCKSSPSIFVQLVTIQDVVLDTIIRWFTQFYHRKVQYHRTIIQISTRKRNFMPWTRDYRFRKCSINITKWGLPSYRHKWSLFFHTQAFWRNIQKLKLSAEYSKKESIKKMIGKFMNLACTDPKFRRWIPYACYKRIFNRLVFNIERFYWIFKKTIHWLCRIWHIV